MEEQKVSYPVAKLAKKLGFDLEQPFFYGRMFPMVDFQNLLPADKSEVADFSAWAPTQSLLQRWLREKHGLHIELHSPFGAHTTWSFSIYRHPDFSGCQTEDGRYNSYEEALEAGLKDALSMVTPSLS